MNHIISAIVLVLALQLGGHARMGGTAKLAGGATSSSSCTNGALPVSDTFAGTGALDPTCWLATVASFNTISRSSGTAITGGGGTGYGYAVFTGNTFSHTQLFSQITINVTGSNFTGPCLIDSTATGYCYFYTANVVEAVTNGSGTGGVVSGCSTYTSGHAVRLDYADTTAGNFTVTDETTHTVLCTGPSPIAGAVVPGINIQNGDSVTAFSGGN